MTKRKYDSIRTAINDCLREHPDGMTASEIVTWICARYERQSDKKKTYASVWHMLRSPFRVTYIDRYKAVHPHTSRVAYRWEAVYCLAPIPPDAEKPTFEPTGEYAE